MKHIKTYNSFKLNEELDINIDGAAGQNIIEEISDIFIHVKDCGLQVEDVYSGHALSMGDRDIVTDHNDFSSILGPDGKYVGSYKSLSIRLKNENTSSFTIEENLFDELQSAIKHVESQFSLQLNSIYLRTLGGVWFNSVDTMERYINELPFAKRSSLRHVSYLDLTFKDEEEDIDDSISVKESVEVNELESIFDDVKDILRDLEDDHEIDVDIIIGQYHKMYSGGNPAKSWRESEDSQLKNSINIDLKQLKKDIKYNFFRFNDHILPTIYKLKSFVSEYDLNIDIELVQENEFYPLDEFIEEYGSEEFHELGIIIY
jgi:hypothetical protein